MDGPGWRDPSDARASAEDSGGNRVEHYSEMEIEDNYGLVVLGGGSLHTARRELKRTTVVPEV
ncbi:hypothetical protein N7456_007163 [Penicillium angulare]|uniref:Uncharacterized protein n=1 Tax=Penicillium angulare TaxID=116970 RepID=A0A9W9FJ19_9EURO|nr:hypothetical protein N7456_007163 [Penicillium angulare]